jgi:hypothetical protein
MDKLNPYIGKRTLIIGDANTGKTGRALEILQLFLKEGYAKKIAILDMGIESVQGIGGKMKPPEGEPVLYLTIPITAPRLMGKDEHHALQLAEENANNIEKLFIKFQQKKREVLFVNDATLYLQAGRLERFIEILNTASTQVINAYYGSAFSDSKLTRREKKLTEDFMKTCDHVITMPCHGPGV